MARLIEPSKELGYSEIYLDFVSGLDKARHFYSLGSIHDVARRLETVTYDRNRLADILTRQNQGWGANDATMANIEALRRPDTLCVFAGQQPGLLTGPMLVILKAIGIIKAAEQYCRELDRPVIPIFWIAGDDHDFVETNHTWVLDKKTSEPVKAAYAAPPAKPIPTADITFSDKQELSNFKARLKEALGETDFTSEVYDLIDQCYTPDDTLVTSFARFMNALIGQYGLVLFSPADPEVKKMVVPYFLHIIDRQDELHSLISEANAHIERHGYHVQVAKKDRATYLFCNLDGRTPIHRESDGTFLIGDRRFTRDALADMVQKEPWRFSPDVMTRPVMQSWLFPALSQKGGPAEIAYLAQVDPLFALFDRVAPFQAPRPSATFIERHNEKVMQQYSISFEDLAGDIEQVVNRVLAESFPSDLDEQVTVLRETVERQFRVVVERALQFDKQLESVASTIYGKIDFNLKQFEGKVFAAHKRKSGATRDRVYRLRHALYTNRALQERSLNVTYFLSKYGLNFITFAYEQLDSEEKAHQLISLSDYRS